MAKLRTYRVPTQIAWAASGAISQELSPIPFTVTGMYLDCHIDLSTTTATNFNDYWDRIIATLNLTGLVDNQNKTFFSFSEMRLPYHASRKRLRSAAPPRPTVVANSQTDFLMQFGYLIHFGRRPFKPDGSYNKMDVTGGIPPTGKGQLTLGGSFGVAAAPGTNATVQSGQIDVYLFGVQAEDGDDPALWMPQAFPMWGMQTITPTATSTIFNTTWNVPAGGFLPFLASMTTKGTNNPRSNAVLNSIRIYDTVNGRDVVTYGGRAGASDAAGGDYQAAELISQLGMGSAPRSDDVINGTIGVPSLNQPTDAGLVFFELAEMTSKVHPLYGADLRGVGTGDYQLQEGVASVSTITQDVLLEKYEPNPNHPANAALL